MKKLVKMIYTVTLIARVNTKESDQDLETAFDYEEPEGFGVKPNHAATIEWAGDIDLHKEIKVVVL